MESHFISRFTPGFLIALGFMQVAQADTIPPVRIMPLGDSITEGGFTDGDNDGSYRNELYDLLTGVGYNVDFVGNETDLDNDALPDRDHQAISGIQINEVRASLPIWFKTVEDPDLILIHLGTNDFGAGASPAEVSNRTKNLVRKTARLRPHAKMIVASLIPRTDLPQAALNQTSFNQALSDLIDEESALGRNVYFVEMHSALDPAQDLLPDGLHPNTSGYGKMAAVWSAAIQSIIAPEGSDKPPYVARLEARESLTQVAIRFSKPVEDVAASTAHFEINDGLGSVAVTEASLDDSKRVVTLTTEPMTAGDGFTLTVNGVKDRTPGQLEIADNTELPFIARPLINGSFEDDAAGWTVSETGSAIVTSTIYPKANATDGEKFLIFNANDTIPEGILSQTIPTEPGRKYLLHFDMGVAGSATGTQILKLIVRGNTTESTVLYHTEMLANPANGRPLWTTKSLEFVADDTEMELILKDVSTQTNSIDMLVDDVRIELPESNGGPQSLPVNGGFEAGKILPDELRTNLDGWTVSGTAFGYLSNPPAYVPSEGSRLAVFNGGGDDFDGVISQSFTTEPGQTYLLALDLGITGNSGRRQALDISIKGGSLDRTWREEITASGQAASWLPRGYSFVADSTNTTLTLSDASAGLDPGLSSLADLLVDNVLVVAGEQRTLTITAEPEDVGSINISVLQTDATGSGNGTKPFTRAYADGSIVNLTAPLIANGYVFEKWRKGSLDYTNSTEAVMEIQGDETITAIYVLNVPPVAQDDSYVVERDLDLVIVASEGVLANDSDPNNIPLSAVLVDEPDFGQLTLNGDGSFTYVPDPGYEGMDIFTYVANDGTDDSNIATVSLNVIAPVGGLLANGSFEVGSPVDYGPLHGWTVLGGDPFGFSANSFSFGSYEPSNGDRMAVFNGGTDNFLDSIAQTFATVPGQRYVVEFDLGITGQAAQRQRMDVTVVSGGSSWSWQDEIVSDGPESTRWTSRIYAFIADDVETALIFSDASGSLPLSSTINADMMLDRISVTEGILRTLTVNSDPYTGLAITMSPADENNQSNGFTNFTRSYLDAEIVTLTAPATSGTDVFQKWLKHGLAFSANPTILLTIAGDITLTAVYGSNLPPVAVSDNYNAEAGSTLFVDNQAFGLLANDSDPDQDALTAMLLDPPANGTVDLFEDGTFTYTPDSGFTGADSFTYVANDGELDSDPATVTITVLSRTGILVANGGFEVGMQDEDGFSFLDYWTVSFIGDFGPFGYIENSFPGSATYQPSQGERMAVFNGGNNNFTGEISQSLSTIPGRSYAIEFDLGITGETDREQKMEISASGALESPWQETIVSAGPSLTYWESKTFTFVATESNTTLTFRDASGDLPVGAANNSDMMLDNVRVYELAPPVNDFDDWLAGFGITDGPDVDSDGDGISNLIEYIIGGSPGTMDAGLLPTAELVFADPDGDSNSSDYLLFSYRRTERSANNPSLDIRAEWNTDLGAIWNNTATTAGVVILVQEALEPGVDLVNIYVPTSLATHGRLFVRLVGMLDTDE